MALHDELRAPSKADGPINLFVAALWFAVVGGSLQAAIAAYIRYDLERYTHLSRHVVWSAPISAMCALAIPGSIAWLVHRRRPTLAVWRASIAVFATLSVWAVLLYARGFHPAALLVLAAGISVVISRVVTAHRAGFSLLVRRSLPLLIGSIVIVATVLNVGLHVRERRAIAALPDASANAPNVLLLILDTVRSLDLSLYGYSRATTPEISAFAARGVIFDNAIAPAPWTLPSHASMFTGHSAADLSSDWRVPLDDTYPTLAEVLASRGYLTAGFVGNLAYASTESGLNRGFAHYEGFLITVGNILASGMIARTVTQSQFVRDLFDWHELVERKPASSINRRAINWLSEHPARPWFAFLNFYDAHDPYLPPAPYDTAFTGRPTRSADRNFSLAHAAPVTPAQAQVERDAYDQSIRSLDHEVGSLLREMDGRGLLKNTIVIITADHGEEFGEHGLLSHGSSLYLPSLRVPLVIVAPGRTPANVRVPRVVSLRDLAATVLDLSGNPTVLPGASLRGAWTNDSTVPSVAFSAVRYAPRLPAWYPANRGDMLSVVSNEQQLIRDGRGAEEVFDLTVDSTGGTHDTTGAASRLRSLLPHPRDRD